MSGAEAAGYRQLRALKCGWLEPLGYVACETLDAIEDKFQTFSAPLAGNCFCPGSLHPPASPAGFWLALDPQLSSPICSLSGWKALASPPILAQTPG
jgi:hypothetical protein